MSVIGPAQTEAAFRAVVGRLTGTVFTPRTVRLKAPLSVDQLVQRLAPLPGPVVLASARVCPLLGRFTIATADPLLHVTWRGGAWYLYTANRVERIDSLDPLADLAELCRCFRLASLKADHVPFCGGWIGWFGYELGTTIERHLPARFDDFRLPYLSLAFYEWAYVEDRVGKRAYLVVADAERRERAAWCERLLSEGEERVSPLIGTYVIGAGEPLAPEELAPYFPTPCATMGVYSDFTVESYLRAVRQALAYIHAGDVYQVNLSQRLVLRQTGERPERVFCRLCRVNPAFYAAWLRHGEVEIVSCSPEQFLRVRGRHVETRPIKGTRPRWPTPEADLAARVDLATSPKDRAENVMIVDLLRNDLGRVCRYGTVRVTAPLEVHSYPFVHHLVSTVEGELRDGCGAVDLLRAAFPGGSVTGAPKVRAMEIIAELEPTVRGPYCGAIGFISVDGTLELSVAIRTMTFARGWVQVPVGGGIVADSVPEREYEETWHKARGMLRSLVER